MDANELKTLQTPIKERYREDPERRRHHAEG